MGVLSGKDLLTSKYVTAEITDSENRVHYIPIKHTIGDYFLADLDGKLFAFTLKNARVLTHYKTLTKSFRVIQYDTTHYSSIKPDTKALELFLEENKLPRMNRVQHNALRVLARREGKEFKEHDLKSLVEEFAEHKDKYPTEVNNMLMYLNELNTDKIVTPVRKITEFITEDLIATNPSFLGEALPQYKRVDLEDRKITNSPIKPTGNLLKFALIGIMGFAIVAGLAYANETGAFDGLFAFTDSFSNIGKGLSGLPAPGQFQTPPSLSGGIDYSDAAIQAKYTPEGLKLAIDRGEIEYDKLSSFMQDMVDNVETPSVAP